MIYFFAKTIFQEEKNALHTIDVNGKLYSINSDGYYGEKELPVFSQDVLFDFLEKSSFFELTSTVKSDLLNGKVVSGNLTEPLNGDNSHSVYFQRTEKEPVALTKTNKITQHNFKEALYFDGWHDFYMVNEAIVAENEKLAVSLIEKRISKIKETEYFYGISDTEINKRAKEALKAIYDLKNNHSKIIPTSLSYVKSLSPKDLSETDFIMFSLGNKLNCEFRYIKNDDGQLELKIRNVITGDYFPPSLIDELYLVEKFKISS